MKSHIFLLSAFAVLMSSFVSSAVAQSDTKESARRVFEENNQRIFGIRSLVKLEASMQGKQVINREMPAYGIGTVISDGLLITSYRTIKPKASANVQGAAAARMRGLEIETTVKEIKLVDESGEEFDAKLVLHDEDLDLAFVALDKDGDNAESWSCQPIDISEDIELQHLDDVVFLSRAGESMRFQPSVRVGQVNTIIKRPRKLYSVNNMVLGSASFNLDGKFVGLAVRKKSGSGSEFSAVLPAKYINKLVPQAIEKANSIESTEEDSEDLAESTAEPEAEESSDKASESESENKDGLIN